MDPMDRPVDPAHRRRRILRRGMIGVAVVAAGVTLIAVAIGWFRPSVRHDRIRLATVTHGEVTATLDATGLVAPEFEHVLTAPVSTRIARIHKTAGSEVQPGQVLVQLDDHGARLEVEKLDEQIALKQNARRRAELERDRTRADLQSRHEIKALELKSFLFEVDRNQQLFDMGLVMQDAVRKSETDVERATIELAHFETQLANAEADLAARLEGLELEMAILAKDREQAGERLARTAVASDRAGIVTWVVPSEGVTVAAGETVARVADLSTFRVNATLSDVLARRLAAGMPATVRSGDARLPGHVRKILPTVQNGVVTFEVALDSQDHAVLRPNLRVDVHVVTETRAAALRLERGPVLNVDGRDAVFVIRGERAVRTPITLGISNFEHYEIVEGLVAGDEVIISDMSDYRTVKEVQIR